MSEDPAVDTPPEENKDDVREDAMAPPSETETPIPPKVLETPFRLRVTDDRMRVLISGQVGAPGMDDLLACLRKELERLQIAEPSVLLEAAQRFRTVLEGQTEVSDVVLLEGTPPSPPQDAFIEWAGDFFKPGYEIDPVTGAADYRRPVAKVVVTDGQLLATVHPPVEGLNGHDVFGRAVLAPKPRAIRVRVGNNVRHEEESGTFYATRDGRIRFINDMLYVDDLYLVPGSVDLKTGHVKHPGAVIVSQNIEAESRVEADGDIEVRGYVEDADIVTGGNLIVHGGIFGQPHRKIRVAGDLHAKFITNACLEVGESVQVERELDQSIVKTRGAITVSGRIVGGHVIALGGIEADQVGSDACVRTQLTAGEDYTLHDRIASKEIELQEGKETLAKIMDKVTPLKDRGHELPQKLRDAVAALSKEAARLQNAIQALEEEIETVRAESRAREKKEILARKRIYPESLCHIMGLTLHVKEPMEGPVKVAIREGDIQAVPVHSRH